MLETAYAKFMSRMSALINKLSWNGLIIIWEFQTEMVNGVVERDFNKQTFDTWEDLAIEDWSKPPSSLYPSIQEILDELYNLSWGENPLAVFDKNRNLIWERSHGAWLESGLPVP